jgi:hypothetical protein
MTKAEELHRKAEEAEAKAENARDRNVKSAYYELARHWRDLAQEAERFGHPQQK